MASALVRRDEATCGSVLIGLIVSMCAADTLASVVEDVRHGMDVRQHADAAYLLEVESEAARRQPPAVANAALVRERADIAAGLIEDNLRSGAWGVVGRQEDLVRAGAMPRTSAFTVEWDKPRGCIDCLGVNANTAPRRVQLEGKLDAEVVVERCLDVDTLLCRAGCWWQVLTPCATTWRSRTMSMPRGRPRWIRPAAMRTTYWTRLPVTCSACEGVRPTAPCVCV